MLAAAHRVIMAFVTLPDFGLAGLLRGVMD
jgi:hypothetical protein